MKTTAVIILNYNNYEDTLNCIESVESHNTAPIKLIVVDNGSSRKGTAYELGKYLKQKFSGSFLHLDDGSLKAFIQDPACSLPYVTYIESSTNDGYARGNNKALFLTEKDEEIEFVMILNNDVLFVQDIIPGLYGWYHRLADAAILSPLLYKRDMEGIDLNCARINCTLKLELAYYFFHPIFQLFRKQDPFLKKRYLIKDERCLPEVLKIELLSGSCMFIRKTLFSNIGFFDPHTFLYWEESILFKKTERISMQNYLITDCKCIHLGASSTSTSSVPFFKYGISSGRYYMRNYANIRWWQYSLFVFSQLCYITIFNTRNVFRKLLGKK